MVPKKTAGNLEEIYVKIMTLYLFVIFFKRFQGNKFIHTNERLLYRL